MSWAIKSATWTCHPCDVSNPAGSGPRECVQLAFHTNGAWPLLRIVMPRTRALIVCLLVGAIPISGLVCGIGAANHRISKRFYQGKPMEYWFNQLGNQEIMRSPSGAVRTWGSWIETPEASAHAIRGIGTNALGFYLRKLKRQVVAREIQIAKVARAVGFEDFWIRGIDSERGQAVIALILLKPLPSEVVSELVTLSTNRNREIAAAAHCALVTTENELVTLHSPARKQSLDLDLLNLPNLSDLK